MAVDCRHGRVLIHTNCSTSIHGLFVVWDPITGDQKQVPSLHLDFAWDAAVLCAVAGCDHLDCSGGPFHIVFVNREEESDTWASRYSSETSTWSPKTRIDRLSLSAIFDDIDCCVRRTGHLNGDALYFFLGQLLKYDLGDRSLTAVDVPEMFLKGCIIMNAEDGALGFAGMDDTSCLYLWSRTDAGWALRRVIKLDDGLIPTHNRLDYADVVAFMEGTSTVFIDTNVGVFTLDLKSILVRNVGDKGEYVTVLPYASFYAPAAAVRATGPRRIEAGSSRFVEEEEDQDGGSTRCEVFRD